MEKKYTLTLDKEFIQYCELNKIENIDNTVICYILENPLTIDFIREVIKNKELRREWIEMGEKDAIPFISKFNTSSQIV
jgi:hypothetical protein